MKQYVNSTTPKNTLVYFDFESLPEEYHNKYPNEFNYDLLYLGEMAQMPGHCVVATKDGRVYWGYETSNFFIVPDEEV